MTQQQTEAVEADDVEEELDDQEQPETDGEDSDGEQEPEYTPPTREQWEATQAKLKRAREQARKLREAKQTAATSAPDPQAAAAAQADVEKWQTRAVRTAAKAELLSRGADADMVDLALGRLKPNSVEFDDDDQPDLEEWLDEIQDRYPKLFKQPEAPAPVAQRPKAGRVETPTGKPVRAKATLGEQILANSLGANGRRRG